MLGPVFTASRSEERSSTVTFRVSFDLNPLVPEFFAILAKIYCPTFGDAIGTNGLYMHYNLDTFFMK